MIVFFDVGATLIAGPPLTPARQIAAELGLDDATRRDLDRRLLTSMVRTPGVLAALLVSLYGVPTDLAMDLAAAVWQAQTEIPQMIEGGRELLSVLRTGDVQYGFISNIWFPYATTFARLYGPLADVELRFFSFRLGVAKPDLVRQAVMAAGVAAAACVMVGDSYETDMQPAIALGMRTIWLLHRPEKEHVWSEKIAINRLHTPDRALVSIADIDMSTIMDLFQDRHTRAI